MIESLERAADIEPSIQSYHILADAYDRLGETEKSVELRDKIQKPLQAKIHLQN